MVQMLVGTTGEEARAFDERLRFLTTARTRVQRLLGQGLDRFYRGGGLLALCYSSRRDYLRERLGLGLRDTQDLVLIEQRIVQYPETARLWDLGLINRCHVRELVAKVAPEDDFAWARLASVMTVRQLQERLGGRATSDDGAGGHTLAFEASPTLRAQLPVLQDMVNALMGEDVGLTGCLDVCAMEWHAGAARQDVLQLFEEGKDNTKALRDEGLAQLARLKSAREEARERATAYWRDLPSSLPSVVVPTFVLAEDASPFDIDATLRQVVRFGQEVDSILMHTLVEAFACNVPTALGFDSLEHYGRERLGMSATFMWTLLRLGKGLRLCPPVQEAYQVGELSKCQAQEVLRVASPPTVHEWIRYSRTTTVRQLRSVVQKALVLRREAPAQHADILPPQAVPLQDARAQDLLEDALARMEPGGSASGLPTCAPGLVGDELSLSRLPTCAPLPRVPEVRYLPVSSQSRSQKVWVPDELDEFFDDTLRLCRIWLSRPAATGECIELLVTHFLAQYEAEARQSAKDHPIQERDEWRCKTPGCTRKAMLHAHHMQLASQGGSNQHDNLSSLCAFHHLKCLHEGRMAAVGAAPDNIAWIMGIQPDGTPTELYANDTRVAGNP